MERQSFITEETKINIDEEAFKIKAKEFICESFVEYVNNLYQANVVAIKK